METKEGITKIKKQENILSLKINELNANPGTSNGQTNSFYNTGQQHILQNHSQTDFRDLKNHKRFRSRNNYQQPDRYDHESQQQFQYPTKSYQTQQSFAQLKPCRYQVNPIFNSSFSDQNFNSSESENSFFDESASDSKLMAYNRNKMHRNSNINGTTGSAEYPFDNRINFLHNYNDHSQNPSNSYGNEYNNPNNNSQVTLTPVYQSHSNENLAPQQQPYAGDYQSYENK